MYHTGRTDDGASQAEADDSRREAEHDVGACWTDRYVCGVRCVWWVVCVGTLHV
jgi:hypothetical protein